jgi:hypothetical protein
MPTSYLPYNPQQQMLLPHALQEWLPEGHLAYYSVFKSKDYSTFYRAHSSP